MYKRIQYRLDLSSYERLDADNLARALILQAIMPCVEEGLATRD